MIRIGSQNDAGFTLVELITTLLIIGVLAVTVLPRFFDSSGYQEYTYRDLILADLRLIQIRAMNQRNDADVCHRFVISADRYGNAAPDISCPVTIAVSDTSGIGRIIPNSDGITLSVSGQGLPFVIEFDYWGKPINACAGGCTINVQGLDTLSINIESQGYIH